MTDPVREALLNITAQIGYDKIKDLVSEIREDGRQSIPDHGDPEGSMIKSNDEYVLEVRDIYQWLLKVSHTIDRAAPER